MGKNKRTDVLRPAPIKEQEAITNLLVGCADTRDGILAALNAFTRLDCEYMSLDELRALRDKLLHTYYQPKGS